MGNVWSLDLLGTLLTQMHLGESGDRHLLCLFFATQVAGKQHTHTPSFSRVIQKMPFTYQDNFNCNCKNKHMTYDLLFCIFVGAHPYVCHSKQRLLCSYCICFETCLHAYQISGESGNVQLRAAWAAWAEARKRDPDQELFSSGIY